MTTLLADGNGSGSGNRLPAALLISSGLCTAVATVVSSLSIFYHLKNYRKPHLQRMVIRIMLMVPIYAIASLISIFSLNAAFFIDAIRDVYEAFVIYCFFELLLGYLGGERSLLILVHGRPPKDTMFPMSLFRRELDVSDPYTFLFLKRGILQYVQIKPILAVITLILKVAGLYNEGDIRWDAGYIYISIVYNFSIFLALYCLAMFWMCVSEDLKPFRPTPKFLCVKGVLFFTFWQSIAISIFIKLGGITKLGPYTDDEHISLGLTDTLICLEMPLFALAHSYAFSHTDFVDPQTTWVARMRIWYAVRDAWGIRDVVEDTKATLNGEGIDYREFEPAEGYMHQGLGRERRIRAGLRYADGGRKKYWLPKTTAEVGGGGQEAPDGIVDRGVNRAIGRVAGYQQEEDVYAPLLEEDADNIVHLAPDLQPDSEISEEGLIPGLHATSETDRDAYLLPFGDIDHADEELFAHARRYLFGDYNYPVIDASSEQARWRVWEEEERILSDARGAYFSPVSGQNRPLPAHGGKVYGATSTSSRARVDSTASNTGSHSGGSKGASPRNNGKERLINYEDNQTVAVETSDVRMKWTKSKTGGGNNNSRHAHFTPEVSRTNSGSGTPHRGSPLAHGSSAARGQAGQSHGPPAISRNTSSRSGDSNSGARAPPSPIDENKRPVLPPDAVDLVVEDPDAEKRISEEHRKGEPQAHEFRRVYRRGFVMSSEDGQDEIEGEIEERGNPKIKGRDARSRDVERNPVPPFSSGGGNGSGGQQQADGEDYVRSSSPPMIQELDEPPSHARVLDRSPSPPMIQEMDQPPPHARVLDRLPSQDDNPWA